MSARRSLVLVAVLVGSTVAMAGPVAGTQSSDSLALSNSSTAESFAVRQGDTCYDVTPLGDGSTTVETYYDYSVDDQWSSQGTTRLQDNQVSNLFVYNGSQGYSLVLLHDEHADSPHGSTATMTFTGLPPSGEWVVEDDDYETADDNFTHFETWSTIDWMWSAGRTDGAAFRGLTAAENITIEPAFNEAATNWGDWRASGTADDRVERWRLYTDSETTVDLTMDRNVTVSPGPCDATPPTALLSAAPVDANTTESVTLDAGASRDNSGIRDYHWDVDGDDVIDVTTNTSTITHTYETTGSYEASVTVRDSYNNTATATTVVTITNESAEPTETATATENATTTSSDGPGFGLLTGLLAAVLAVSLLARRR